MQLDVRWLVVTIAVAALLWRTAPPHAKRKWLLVTIATIAAQAVVWHFLFEPYEGKPDPISEVAGLFYVVLYLAWLTSMVMFALSWRKPRPEEELTANPPRELPNERLFGASEHVEGSKEHRKPD